MWHRVMASVLILPVLHRARLGESKATDLCPLCFIPSLQTMPRTWSDGTGGKWPGCGLGGLPDRLLARSCGRRALWLQNSVVFKPAGEPG